MKLSEYAKKHNVTYITAHNWYKKGLIPNAFQVKSGTIVIPDQEIKKQRNVIYCRVSSKDRKNDLNLQVERCKQYCVSKGIQIDAIYQELASGMNDNRKQFWKMIESNPTLIVCQNKDRLTRFGFNYLQKLLKKLSCNIEVIFPNENNETDLLKDLVSIVTSFCCRLYGLRRGINKVKKIEEQLKIQESFSQNLSTQKEEK